MINVEIYKHDISFYCHWRLITLQYCGVFCHTLTWISQGCTCAPYLNPPPTSFPSHPSGWSQYTGPENPVSCIEPGLVIYFTYEKIHVSYYSLKSSHPRLHPQSPKVCSLHLCLFCCLAYRVIVTIFLQFSSVQSLSRVQLFATPWIAAHQASLSITNSRSSLRLMSIQSVMPSSHLILCHPLLLLPPIPPRITVFSNESTWVRLDFFKNRSGEIR